MIQSHSTQWISEVKKLPVLPQVATKIAERIQSPIATVTEISDLIQSDAGIAAHVLKLANSSYYSVPGGVSDISKALQYLGFTTISQLVLTTSIFGTFKSQGSSLFNLTSFWKHSFGVGLAAEIATRVLQQNGLATSLNSNDAFIAGVMHDLGKLIWLELSPEQFNQILQLSKEKQIEFIEAEKELGFPTHVTLALTLGEHWKLPQHILKHIDHHTHTHIISWANYWAHTQGIGNSGSYFESFQESELKAAQELGIKEFMQKQILTHFELEFKKAEAILSGH